MTTHTRLETAKILQFPLKATAGAIRIRRLGQIADQQPTHYPTVEFGSGWYHDAAIQDAQHAPKP